ncbi:phenylalanine--tRNA ligase subunit beta [bacterium]|nr:phenylalanine--tRNA ligase subunit beta [bacterium]
MKISLNWIKDFVEIDRSISSLELVQTITLSTCEVEGFEETGVHLKNIVAARVINIEKHPNAEKLSLVTIDHGQGKQRVVCGASNFKEGDIVPYANEGITLPGNFVIKKTEIRGVESCGMLCAEDELGFSDDHSGLMILQEDTIPGTSLDKIFPDQVDIIMEIDNKSITHRPDLWGHYGFAREIGAIYKTPVKQFSLNLDSITGAGEKIIDVEVTAGELVPRFSGLSIDNIFIDSSPLWIQHRLSRVGLRPINNMVDLTNYVMLELGQPMHAFDADKIAGRKLIVRLADNRTKVMTLHQKEVELTDKDLTICDSNGASVVAGVVGGKDSGVVDSTCRVFLEAANWDPVNIRKTSTRIGLRTDASKRFEKSLDPEMSMLAIQRAVEVMKMTNPDLRICGSPVDIVNKKNKPIQIDVDTAFICKRLGKDIEDAEIKGILSSLGFKVNGNGSKMSVEVPSYRRTKDVSIPEDLVEEIGRIYGFNNIEPKAPVFPIERPVFNLQHQFEQQSKAVLAESKYHEVYNYPLTNQKAEDLFNFNPEGIMKLKNPVADHQVQMRTSLLPHFIDSIQENQKISTEFRLFEIGRVYRKVASGSILESNRLISGVSTKKDKPGKAFYRLKNDISNLFSSLQIGMISFDPIEAEALTDYQHKYISGLITSADTILGKIYALSPLYMDILGLREDVCIAELDFDVMFSIGKKEYLYITPPRFPGVYFELSLVVPKKTLFKEISDRIYSVSNLVNRVDYLDVYHTREFGENKSISVSIEFRSYEKTLESDEVKSLQDNVVQELAMHGYMLREG